MQMMIIGRRRREEKQLGERNHARIKDAEERKRARTIKTEKEIITDNRVKKGASDEDRRINE